MKLNKQGRESNNFEKTIKEYIKQAQEKLENDFAGTREAIRIIAKDKTKDYIRVTDRGLEKNERDLLDAMITASMYQSFCYGYGIGKIEGITNEKIYL